MHLFIFIFGEQPRPLSPPRVPSGFRTGTRVAPGRHRYAGDVSRVRASQNYSTNLILFTYIKIPNNLLIINISYGYLAYTYRNVEF